MIMIHDMKGYKILSFKEIRKKMFLLKIRIISVYLKMTSTDSVFLCPTILYSIRHVYVSCNVICVCVKMSSEVREITEYNDIALKTDTSYSSADHDV